MIYRGKSSKAIGYIFTISRAQEQYAILYVKSKCHAFLV